MNTTLAVGVDGVGEFDLNPTQVDPRADIIDKSWAMCLLHSKWSEKVERLDLRFSAGPMPASASVDAERAAQVVTNLVTNSLKFTPEGGIVSLEAGCIDSFRGAAGCFLKVVIRDTGVGLTEEGKSRLFKPFSQADDDVKERFGGTGLGCARESYYELRKKRNHRSCLDSSVDWIVPLRT